MAPDRRCSSGYLHKFCRKPLAQIAEAMQIAFSFGDTVINGCYKYYFYFLTCNFDDYKDV